MHADIHEDDEGDVYDEDREDCEEDCFSLLLFPKKFGEEYGIDIQNHPDGTKFFLVMLLGFLTSPLRRTKHYFHALVNSDFSIFGIVMRPDVSVLSTQSSQMMASGFAHMVLFKRPCAAGVVVSESPAVGHA